MPRKVEDLTNKKFHRLRVILRHSSKHGRAVWECLCDPDQGGCGNVIIVAAGHLKSGNTGSCGCLQKDATSKANKKHGLGHTQEYRIWNLMLERCYNPKHGKYIHYGGRGIDVCSGWKDDFMAFYNDMGPRPSPSHTLDRKDNDLGYSKDNCHWATWLEQANNRSNNLHYEFDGEKKTLAAWCRELRIDYNRMYYLLRNGMTFEDAADTTITESK